LEPKKLPLATIIRDRFSGKHLVTEVDDLTHHVYAATGDLPWEKEVTTWLAENKKPGRSRVDLVRSRRLDKITERLISRA
jgi:hypothetical protein